MKAGGANNVLAQPVAARFTVNDHVGTLLRFLLLVSLTRKLRSRTGIARQIRWAGILGLFASELYSWLVGRLRPPGRLLSLSRGRCHVLDEAPTVAGAPGAPAVVLVHGFCGSHHYFNYLARALRASGRRVIRLDNYGRGFSTAGAGSMDATLFVEQLFETLECLDVGQVDLVGYSMGGAIAIAFAAKHPEKLHSLVLLAAAGMRSCKIPRAATLLGGLPGLDLLLGLIVVSAFARKSSYGGDWEMSTTAARARLTELHAVEVQRLPIEGLQLPHALGRTIARFPMGALTAEARAIGELGHGKPKAQVRTLAVWGGRDSIVPAKGLEELKELIPHLNLHVFETAGHAFPLERAEETAEVMMRFWAGHQSIK